MQSIFSVESENTIAQAIRAKREAKDNKKVQFANVAFSKFISKANTILKNTALTENLASLNQTFSSKNSSFKGLNSFVSHFKIDELPQNSQGFEYDEALFDRLQELIEEYQGTKGELKDAERFLLGLMKELVGELDELGFNNAEFKSYYEAYEKQLAEKETLKVEIVELANKYLDAEDELHGEILLGSIANKLRDYHSALQDGDLRNFFAPILQYLSDNAQENIIKALYTINEELKDPEAFELNGGARLVWEVDGERIKFKILDENDLQQLHAEHQKSKTFKTIVNSFEKSDTDGDLNEPNLSQNAPFDSSTTINENLSFGANLRANSPFNANLNSTPPFNELFNLAFKMSENAKANAKANSNAQSLLKGLLQDF